jgi:integrase/recombinase XerD
MTTTATSQLIERFLEYKRSNQGLQPSSLRKYRSQLYRLAAYCQRVDADPLNPGQDVLATYTGPFLHKEGVGARARRSIVAAIREFYRWLHLCRHTPRDHSIDVIYPKAGKVLPIPISLDYAEKLLWAPDLDTFMGVRDAAMLSVLLGCGLRVTGLVALNESSLRWSYHGGRETLDIFVREKGEKDRLLPAPDETRLMLRAYLGHHELDSIDRTLPDGDRVLFVSMRNRTVPAHEYRGENRRIRDGAVRDMIIKYGTAAGVPRNQLRPHAFRHLYGTELAEANLPLELRMMLMGHTNPSSTEIYTHLATRRAREAVGQHSAISKINTPVTELLRRL